ncbi:MAG: hypothetical protein WAL42_05515, partial [Nitrososphaeraceae archaeon]
MRNIIRCNDTLPKMLDSNLCMLSVIFCLLATVLILGTIFPVATSGILSTAYADLPTERDPAIDVETVRLGKG